MSKKTLAALLIAVAILVQPCVSAAQSDYEFYFFGVNLKAFKNSNWLMLTAGAVSSLLAHELGHALYLESQGKDWDLTASSSGFAVRTNNHLSDSQYQNFGRAGFAFQAGIGAVLTSFKRTRNSDFTKGWVSMNAAQIWTYDRRKNDRNDDFALIEKGNGDKRLDFGVLALVSQNNLLAITRSDHTLLHVPYIETTKHTSPFRALDDVLAREKTGQNMLLSQSKNNNYNLTQQQLQSPNAAGSGHQQYGLLKSAMSYLTLSPLFE